MGLFRTQKRKPSYDLFSRYSHYLPSVGGTFILFVMFLLGAVLGNIVVLCMQAASAEFAEKFGMLVSYPFMFIPPMLYASAKSRRNEIFNEGYALDSSNFGKYGGLVMALVVSASTAAMAFVVEPVVSLLPDMPEWLEQVMEQMLTGGPLWVTLISVSVFAPFFEEWLCRGMVMRGLLKHTSPATAILLSSLFFAVLHMNPWQAIPAFCLGVLFGSEADNAHALREQHHVGHCQPDSSVQGGRYIHGCDEPVGICLNRSRLRAYSCKFCHHNQKHSQERRYPRRM